MRVDDAELIRANLRGEMARRGKSKADVANALGCSPQYLGRKLDGDAMLTVADLDRFAKMFNLSVYQLMMLLLQPIDSIKQVNK